MNQPMIDSHTRSIMRYLDIFRNNCLRAQDAYYKGDKRTMEMCALRIKSALSYLKAAGVEPC